MVDTGGVSLGNEILKLELLLDSLAVGCMRASCSFEQTGEPSSRCGVGEA